MPSVLRAMPLAVLLLVTVTACTTVIPQRLGNPQEPYPQQTMAHVGDIIHLPTGITVKREQMVAIAADARIVYIGETHDNPASHRLQLETLKALADLHPGRQALGMEMFSRSQQPALDRWVAGELDEKSFLKASRWFEVWKMDFAYYRDILHFARDRHIPIIALNAEKNLAGALRSKKPEELSAEQRAQLPELDLTDPYHRALVTAILGDHSHAGMQIDGFLRAQTLWDETMAESVATYLTSQAGKDKHLVVIAGGDHVSHGFGIPRRVFRRLPASQVLIGGREINIPPDKQDKLMDVTLPEFPQTPYDFLVYLAYEDLPKTGVRLGVTTEPAPSGRGLLVREVLAGSNAERSGLMRGDLLLAMDGETLAVSTDLIMAVQQKHPGDRATMKLERQGQILTIDVLFRPAGEGAPQGGR